jgi:hypothetical protein
MPETITSETPNPTAEEKTLAILLLAAQSALIQLIMEGVVPFGQEVHYQLHFHEFVNQLHRDGTLTIGDGQVIKLDNQLVRDYAKSAVKMATDGERIANEIRAKMKEVRDEMSTEQTNKDENGTNIDPDLSPRRVLN